MHHVNTLIWVFSVLNVHDSILKLDKFLFKRYFKFSLQVCTTYRCIAIVTQVFTLNETQVLTSHLYSTKKDYLYSKII